MRASPHCGISGEDEEVEMIICSTMRVGAEAAVTTEKGMERVNGVEDANDEMDEEATMHRRQGNCVVCSHVFPCVPQKSAPPPVHSSPLHALKAEY
jgi:hypothetical protein